MTVSERRSQSQKIDELLHLSQVLHSRIIIPPANEPSVSSELGYIDFQLFPESSDQLKRRVYHKNAVKSLTKLRLELLALKKDEKVGMVSQLGFVTAGQDGLSSDIICDGEFDDIMRGVFDSHTEGL